MGYRRRYTHGQFCSCDDCWDRRRIEARRRRPADDFDAVMDEEAPLARRDFNASVKRYGWRPKGGVVA